MRGAILKSPVTLSSVMQSCNIIRSDGPSPRSIDIAAQKALIALRGLMPELGEEPCTAACLAAIRSGCHIEYARGSVSTGYVSTGPDSASAVAFAVDHGSPEGLLPFLVVQEAASRFIPRDIRRAAADAVALCALYPLSIERERGRKWIRSDATRTLWQVRPAGWAESHLTSALSRRSRLLRQLARLPDSTERPVLPPLPYHEMPGSAVALAAGKALREAGAYRLAARWFRLSFLIARDRGDYSAMAFAAGAQGLALKLRGAYPRAQSKFRLQLRLGERAGAMLPCAFALHDLANIAIEGGSHAEATALARRALRAYPAAHPARLEIAHNIAFMWLEAGHFEAATQAFSALVPHFARERGAVRRLAQSNLCRAAAACGMNQMYERLWPELCTDLMTAAESPEHARTWVNLAYAAVSASDWMRGELAAARAQDFASRRGERAVELAAEAMLDASRRGARIEWRAPPGQAVVRVAAAELAAALTAAV